jgi:hypothetical protein
VLLGGRAERVTRPLQYGFRLEGRLASVRLERVLLLADGVTIALHASGGLKILYGM